MRRLRELTPDRRDAGSGRRKPELRYVTSGAEVVAAGNASSAGNPDRVGNPEVVVLADVSGNS
jgi:hypothetical protein